MLVYLAGPLFSRAERAFNEGLTEKLENRGFRVFLPQRDGVERDKAPYDAMPPEERRRVMFELDEAQIMEADVFLFVLDGRVPAEGACVELGLAHTHRRLEGGEKLLVGLHTAFGWRHWATSGPGALQGCFPLTWMPFREGPACRSPATARR